jgi:hypothetical protein
MIAAAVALSNTPTTSWPGVGEAGKLEGAAEDHQRLAADGAEDDVGHGEGHQGGAQQPRRIDGHGRDFQVLARRKQQAQAAQGRDADGEGHAVEDGRRSDLAKLDPEPVVHAHPHRARHQQVGAQGMGDGVGQEGAAHGRSPGDLRAHPAQTQPFDHAHEDEAQHRKGQGGQDVSVTPGAHGPGDFGRARMAELAPQHDRRRHEQDDRDDPDQPTPKRGGGGWGVSALHGFLVSRVVDGT